MIEGTIPQRLDNIHNLEKLNLNNNTLESKLPTWFPDIKKLSKFYIMCCVFFMLLKI